MKPSTVRRDIVSFVTSIRINRGNVNTEHKPLILSVKFGQAVCDSDMSESQSWSVDPRLLAIEHAMSNPCIHCVLLKNEHYSHIERLSIALSQKVVEDDSAEMFSQVSRAWRPIAILGLLYMSQYWACSTSGLTQVGFMI